MIHLSVGLVLLVGLLGPPAEVGVRVVERVSAEVPDDVPLVRFPPSPEPLDDRVEVLPRVAAPPAPDVDALPSLVRVPRAEGVDLREEVPVDYGRPLRPPDVEDGEVYEALLDDGPPHSLP